MINKGVPNFPNIDFLIDEKNYTHKIELNHKFSQFAKMIDCNRELIFKSYEIQAKADSNLYCSVKNKSGLLRGDIGLCKHRNSFKLISGKKPATWYFGERGENQRNYMVKQGNILHVEMTNYVNL